MQYAKLRKLLNLDGKLRCNLKICNSRRDGFTLIEVIVAIAILAISFVMIMQLFSGGLRISRKSCDYTIAIVHAKDKIEELSLEPTQSSGKFEDGFEWESEVQPYEGLDKEHEEPSLNLLKLKVIVSWEDSPNKRKSVELASLKTVVEDENE